jgi:prophage regulatory protein
VPTNKLTPRRASEGRVLRRREVEAKVGHGPSWIYAEVAAGRFPRPIEIGARSVGWIEDEVDAWIASRPRRHSANKAEEEVK